MRVLIAAEAKIFHSGLSSYWRTKQMKCDLPAITVPHRPNTLAQVIRCSCNATAVDRQLQRAKAKKTRAVANQISLNSEQKWQLGTQKQGFNPYPAKVENKLCS